jgi:large subunit ribosomal protein L17
MRHRKSGVKLNRTTSHRQAMFRNMVTSLFKHERIKTTDAKAKELRRWADHIVTLAKRGDLHARRQAMSIVREKTVVHKLFEEAPERFGARKGGYTRIIKIGRRTGDAAAMTLVELIGSEEATPAKEKKGKAEKQVQPVVEPVTAKVESEPQQSEGVEDTAAVEESEEQVQAADVKTPEEEATEEAASPEKEAAPDVPESGEDGPSEDDKKDSGQAEPEK